VRVGVLLIDPFRLVKPLIHRVPSLLNSTASTRLADRRTTVSIAALASAVPQVATRGALGSGEGRQAAVGSGKPSSASGLGLAVQGRQFGARLNRRDVVRPRWM
jgi:hypothetical protein